MKELLPDHKTSELLAQLAHDMRSPLHSVMGFTQMLNQRCQHDDEVLQWLRNIHNVSKHLLDLVNDVVDLQRLSTAHVNIADEAIDLKTLIEETIDMFQPQAQTAQIALITMFREDCPRFWRADKRKLRQILINLISNAIKFTPPMGEVKVSVIFNTQLEIRVTDSGIGMDEKTKLNLFQPYFHSHARLNQQGTGLGLTITQRLATLMHGSITVDSQRNFGSTFTVKLTLKQDNDVEQSYMLNELIRLEHPITLLLIDDDVLHHQVMAGLLADQPIKIISAYTVKEGIARFNAEQPDLVLCDHQLPDGDGLSLVKMLRKSHDHQSGDKIIKIALLTAHQGKILQDALTDDIVDAVLYKPLELQTLLKLAARIPHPAASKLSEHAAVFSASQLPYQNAPKHLSCLWPEFYKELGQGIEDCHTAYLKRDYATLAAITHRLKGQTMIFHHHGFWRMLESLEDLTLAKNNAMIDGILKQLTHSFEEERKTYEADSRRHC